MFVHTKQSVEKRERTTERGERERERERENERNIIQNANGAI
jgi:hypothetical protein